MRKAMSSSDQSISYPAGPVFNGGENTIQAGSLPLQDDKLDPLISSALCVRRLKEFLGLRELHILRATADL